MQQQFWPVSVLQRRCDCPHCKGELGEAKLGELCLQLPGKEETEPGVLSDGPAVMADGREDGAWWWVEGSPAEMPA